MIDTIVLTLTKDQYQINDPDKFTPSARWAQAAKFPSRKSSIQNPTKQELLHGIYKPRLTLYSRTNRYGKIEQLLKIELSLPKLMFGNNFDELQYKDFNQVIIQLQEALKQMGIITTVDTLVHAPVSAIHYSKNIPLTDGSTPYYYIQKIKEANSKLSLDVNQTDYRNTGHSYRWHCNSYEVIFYDKIKDLEQASKSSKRVIEKDGALQFDLFRLRKRKMFEVLRMEVRLNNRQKIKQLFGKLNIKANLTFKQLFKPAISKKILLHYLEEIENKRPGLLDFEKISTQSFLAALLFNNPTLGPRQCFQLLGLKYALESATSRELRTMFAHCSDRIWYMLMAETKKIKLPAPLSPLSTIRKQLTQFKPLKLKHVKLKGR